MKISKILLLLIILLATGARAEENIANKIESLIHKTDPDLNIGIKITNLTREKVIYEKNANRYFIPASTLKFITVLTLLEYFGEDYNFTSNLFYKDQDYYVDIHDPDFNLDNLVYLLTKLTEHSGKTIGGNIYIINNEFSLPPLMRDKTLGDVAYCYGAPITMAHVNKNCSKLNVEPMEIEENIKIKADSNFPYIIINEAKTISENQSDRLNVKIENGKYIIKGTLSKSTGPITIGAVANDNLSQIKAHLQKQLYKNGITIKGKILFIRALSKLANEEQVLEIYGAQDRSVHKVREDLSTASGNELPSVVEFRKNSTIDGKINDGIVIASLTKNIKDIASIAMKESDNFISNYLLAEFATSFGITEYDWAATKLKEIIKNKFNVDLDNSDIRDGCGISRQNLLTINQFDSFLKAIAMQKNFALVKSILAQSGEKSTLKERFENVNIYAKTGSLTGISALVGYFYNEKQELHSFVIMANNFYQNRSLVRQLQEDVIRLIISN